MISVPQGCRPNFQREEKYCHTVPQAVSQTFKEKKNNIVIRLYSSEAFFF